MVVLTDGKSKDKGDLRIEKVGEQLRKNGDVTVIAVGVNKAKHVELVNIASTEAHVHETKKFTDLKVLIPSLFNDVCSSTGGEDISTTGYKSLLSQFLFSY